MASYIDRKLNKWQEKTNPCLGWIRRLFLKRTDFTIIANNCWGGKVYQYFHLPYTSPTVGLYFFADDYIRFLSDLKHYMDCELTFMDINESRHRERLLEMHPEGVLTGRLDDVEIVFLHYHSKEEAYTKWNRRKQRINWDNLYIKFSEMNQCSMEHLRSFDAMPYAHKAVFVSEDYGLKDQYVFTEYHGRHDVPDDTTRFKYIRPISFLNK